MEAPSEETVVLPNAAHVGKTCPYCQTPLKPHDPVVVCPACRMPHHQDCWEDNGGCTTFGCRTGAVSAPTEVLPTREDDLDLTVTLGAAPVAVQAPPQTASSPGSYEPAPSPGSYARRRRSSSPAGAIIATIAVVALITVIMMVFRSSQSPPPPPPPPPVSQENPHPPIPALEVDGVAGIDRMALDQYLELTVTAENRGAPVSFGSITVSCSGEPKLELLGNDGRSSPRIWNVGEMIRKCTDVRAALEPISASEVGGEAYYHHETWGTGGRRRLRLRITPRQVGTLEIKIRCTLTVAQKEREWIEQQIESEYYNQYGVQATSTIPRYYTEPEQWDADGEDQQGFPAKIYRIEVEEEVYGD